MPTGPWYPACNAQIWLAMPPLMAEQPTQQPAVHSLSQVGCPVTHPLVPEVNPARMVRGPPTWTGGHGRVATPAIPASWAMYFQYWSRVWNRKVTAMLALMDPAL